MPLLQQPMLPLDGLMSGGPARSSNSTAFLDNMMVPVHRWFRYSAGFSTLWAERLIRDHQGRRVLDPFAGSGTTLLAAESAGVEGLGVELHPFISRVARAKLMWRLQPDDLRERAERIISGAASSKAGNDLSPSGLIRKCFEPGALSVLIALRDSIQKNETGDDIDELLWLALVSILRVCSPVGTAQWQYILPNKTKARVAEPLEAFRARIALFADDMAIRQSTPAGPPAIQHEADARTLAPVPDGWADLVVTSPPYANNFDYADAARLEMSFLGQIDTWGDLRYLRESLIKSCSQQMSQWDSAPALESELLEPIKSELMAVYHQLESTRLERAGRKAYHSMILGYFYDSAQTLIALRRACARGARVCYVVGDSAPYGVYVPVERWLGELACSAGFKSWAFEKVRDRNTKWKNRKHRVPLHEGRLWIEG